MYYHDSYHNNISGYWTPGVKLLIISNLVIFGIEVILRVISSDLYGMFIGYFGLWPYQVIKSLWLWQLITCAFLHDVGSILHIIFNMLTLFFFGHLVETYYDTRRFLKFYFFSIIFSSLGYCLIHYFVFSQMISVAIGASGAIMAVLVMSACISPQTTVYLYFIFPIRLRTLIWILVGLDLYMALLNPNGGVAATGHLSGALFGYLYFCVHQRVIPFWYWIKIAFYYIRKWSLQGWYAIQGKKIYNKEDILGSTFQFMNDDVHEDTKFDDDETRVADKQMRAEIDRLLDKVNQEGITSLTPKERLFLYKASQKYRKNIDE